MSEPTLPEPARPEPARPEPALNLPLRRITLFEDRAELLRAGPVPLTAGRGELVFGGLSPLLDDARLTAHFADAAAQVESVRISRRWIQPEASDPDARQRAHRAQCQAAEAALAAAERRTVRARERQQARQDSLARYLGQLGRALWAAPLSADWRAALAALEAALDQATADLSAALTAAAAARRALEALTAAPPQRLPPARLVADVHVRYQAPRAITAPLHLSAVTPCALWRPSHEAERLADGRLRWTAGATVWQATGEDWTDVEIHLSTDRPSAQAHLAPLHPDRLRLQQKAQRGKVILSHREEAIAKDQGEAAVPGVYDGGEARTLRCPHPVSIPSDGAPHRISAYSFTAEASHRLCARPELSALVFRLASLRNPGPEPLLAGPVRLLDAGTWLGEGEIGYIGPGEQFELSLGSDDRFTVRYARSREQQKKLLGADRTHFIQTATLSAVGDARATVHVELRLPVSELDALTIQPSPEHALPGAVKPDPDGRIQLPLDLAPGDHQELSLGFWLDAGSEVVLADPW